MAKKIEQILKPEEILHIAQFTQEDKDWINGRIHDRADGEAGIECIIRGKNVGGISLCSHHSAVFYRD